MAQKTFTGFDAQMENKVKYSQTREYRPSYYSSAMIEVAEHCLRTGDLTLAYVVGNIRFDKLQKLGHSARFRQLVAEYRSKVYYDPIKKVSDM